PIEPDRRRGQSPARLVSLIDISAVVKDYRGLRPLRIDRLVVNASEQVAILGLDQPSAEVLIAVITGAAIPDRGEVTVFGRSTASIADSDEWLSIADRFGIVSERTVLLEAFSVVQNLAVPFSLEIEPPSEAVRERASALTEEVGLPPGVWERGVGDLSASARVRVRLGRALALGPAVVLLEHPSSGVARAEVPALGRDIRVLLERSGVAGLT